ncbi:uroporphyrinogen decarboxylase [Magnetococcales bacterium HHB-1]
MKEPQAPFLRACLRLPVKQTPIWVMRQAGRYLPEYRAIRAEAGNFLNLCKNPQLATEVTLQPLRRFDLDAAILFSDILVIPEAMGQELTFAPNEGPLLKPVIRDREGIDALKDADPEKDLGYVLGAIESIRKALPKGIPLIGFSGSPWTLATYMIEGGSSKTFGHIKKMLYRNPDDLQKLLDRLADNVANYLNAQIRVGAQAIQIFDTWGGVLTPEAYERFSLGSMKRILDQLDRVGPTGEAVPVILFSKNCGHSLKKIAKTGCNVVGLDWTTPIGKAKKQIGHRVALQGNLDPSVLFADRAQIIAEAKKVLRGFGRGPGHIFNLGHGITPEVNPDHLKILVDYVHKRSREMRR